MKIFFDSTVAGRFILLFILLGPTVIGVRRLLDHWNNEAGIVVTLFLAITLWLGVSLLKTFFERMKSLRK